MSVSTVITRGFGSYSNVHGLPVRGYIGNAPTDVTLALATSEWNTQALAVNQRQQQTLTTATWHWNAFALVPKYNVNVTLAQVQWLWSAFPLVTKGALRHLLTLLGVGT